MLRISLDRAPIGTVWVGPPDEHNRVIVTGYERPENAELMTIPPWSEDEMAWILADHVVSGIYDGG